MEYPVTYQTEGGPVTVLSNEKTWYKGQRCYRMTGRGAPELFFGAEGTLGAANVLQLEEHADGTWSAHYKPGYDYFDTYAAELDRLGEWQGTA